MSAASTSPKEATVAEPLPTSSTAAAEETNTTTATSSSGSTHQATAGKPCECAGCNPPPVHPVARFVAGLFSHMSVSQQAKGQHLITNAMYGVSSMSFAIAMGVGEFRICAYAVMVTGAVCLVAFLFNYTQRSDPEHDPKTGIPLKQYVPTPVNEIYYNVLNNAAGYTKEYKYDGTATSAREKRLKAEAAKKEKEEKQRLKAEAKAAAKQ